MYPGMCPGALLPVNDAWSVIRHIGSALAEMITK